MSLSQSSEEGGIVQQPHVAAGAVLAIVGVLFGNRLGGLVGAVAGLVGGFVLGLLLAVGYFSVREEVQPTVQERDGEGGGE